MMSMYTHTQIGYVLLVALGTAAALVTALLLNTGWNLIGGLVVVILILAAALFCSLTVEVKDGTLECRFGPGLIRKRFRLSDIREARVVRNPWYYGWGIHLTPHGWLFNVSGLRAVEITLIRGKQYQIGTDQPDELLNAIRRNARLIA